jgi:hypothetical protein
MANPLTLTDLPPLFPELVTVLCRPLGPARCRRPRRGRPPRNPACMPGVGICMTAPAASAVCPEAPAASASGVKCD